MVDFSAALEDQGQLECVVQTYERAWNDWQAKHAASG